MTLGKTHNQLLQSLSQSLSLWGGEEYKHSSWRSADGPLGESKTTKDGRNGFPPSSRRSRFPRQNDLAAIHSHPHGPKKGGDSEAFLQSSLGGISDESKTAEITPFDTTSSLLSVELGIVLLSRKVWRNASAPFGSLPRLIWYALLIVVTIPRALLSSGGE
jgi:hypothetical protein